MARPSIVSRRGATEHMGRKINAVDVTRGKVCRCPSMRARSYLCSIDRWHDYYFEYDRESV